MALGGWPGDYCLFRAEEKREKDMDKGKEVRRRLIFLFSRKSQFRKFLLWDLKSWKSFWAAKIKKKFEAGKRKLIEKLF